MTTYVYEPITLNTTNTDNLVLGSTTDIIIVGGGSDSPDFQLTGMVGSNGRLLMIHNNSGFALRVQDEDSRSSAVNRFSLLPTYISIPSGVIRTFVYRGGFMQRWVAVKDD